MKNEGKRNTRETSLAKWHATESAFEAAHLAIQVFGSYGYSAEYGIERYFRNARAPIIYEGTTQIHKMMQAEHALGYRAPERPRRRGRRRSARGRRRSRPCTRRRNSQSTLSVRFCCADVARCSCTATAVTHTLPGRPERRRSTRFLDDEADRSSVSVAELIRRAIDTTYGPLGQARELQVISHDARPTERACRWTRDQRLAVAVVDRVAEAEELVRRPHADLVRVGIDRGAGVALVREIATRSVSSVSVRHLVRARPRRPGRTRTSHGRSSCSPSGVRSVGRPVEHDQPLLEPDLVVVRADALARAAARRPTGRAARADERADAHVARVVARPDRRRPSSRSTSKRLTSLTARPPSSRRSSPSGTIRLEARARRPRPVLLSGYTTDRDRSRTVDGIANRAGAVAVVAHRVRARPRPGGKQTMSPARSVRSPSGVRSVTSPRDDDQPLLARSARSGTASAACPGASS